MSGTVQTKGYIPFIESDPRSDKAQLRATMETYGYLFFRGLVPADKVLSEDKIDPAAYALILMGDNQPVEEWCEVRVSRVWKGQG